MLSVDSERCTEAVKAHDGVLELFTCYLPSSSEHIGHMNSKSEYVRCLRLIRRDTLYVATNNGYLYHIALLENGDVKWTELLRVSEKVPIVCMDIFAGNSCNRACVINDWICVGDGNGYVTIVSIVCDVSTPMVGHVLAWPAEMERQLLGAYWCKSLGYRFIFTSDPKGTVKLWRLNDNSQAETCDSMSSIYNVGLVAQYVSCFGIRLMCLDASLNEEVLVCGDLHGNLLSFSLAKSLLFGETDASGMRKSPLSYFKGAHGISSVCSVMITSSGLNPTEIHSTGGDGCICYFEYKRKEQNLEFMGLKQVKPISLVQSVLPDIYSCDDVGSGKYAIGFAASDFVIWNLVSETKVMQIACGGWRRPCSHYLGDVPERENCFAFVKDEVIHVHRRWVRDSNLKMRPRNLHLQFHGREMHTLCFIAEASLFIANESPKFSSSCSWIVTGCEDGTVRLTRYFLNTEQWSASKLLGEHVGGSSIRSLCYVSKVHVFESSIVANRFYRQNVISDVQENHFLLISVGSKRVLTVWKQKIKMINRENKSMYSGLSNDLDNLPGTFPTLSFQWLSTDIPLKSNSILGKQQHTMKVEDAHESVIKIVLDETSGSSSIKSKESNSMPFVVDKFEDDWRYLAVTAFLIKISDSRISVCFIVVSCSDASLTLRALILPYRLWFDVALFVPLVCPVLSLQHVIISKKLPGVKMLNRDLYIVISGSSDGSIAFWDLTETVEAFMHKASALDMKNYIDCQRRPRTGRGSQGGRMWRSLGCQVSKNIPVCDLVGTENFEEHNMQSNVTRSLLGSSCAEKIASDITEEKLAGSLGSKLKPTGLSLEICKILPLHVFKNVHLSGVNCLHVSEIKHLSSSSASITYCILSGGDDQALYCHGFDLAFLALGEHSDKLKQEKHRIVTPDSLKSCMYRCEDEKVLISFLSFDKIRSAHSSAIKGVWTDGRWVFSTGLDQRVRCWKLEQNGKLIENAQLIVSVPEPEALDARACERNYYQIAVTGRGMQMIEFFAPDV